jgi:O-antigen/teichoic acid export membrane protein
MLKLVVKNAMLLLGAELFSKLIYVIFFAFLARYLLPTDTGTYITLLTFVSFGLFFSNPGLSQTLIRNISGDPSKASAELSHGIILSACFGLVAWGGMVTSASAFSFSEKLIPLLAISGISLVFESWAQMASAYIRAQQRMAIIALGNSLSLAIFSTLGIYLLIKGSGLIELTVLIIFQAIFNCVFFWRAAIRLGLSFPRIRWDLPGTAIFAGEAIPIALLAGCNIALNHIDIVMLSKMKGMSDTAIYGLAVKLINSLYLLSGSILAALFPFFSSQWKKPNSEIYKTFKYSFKFFLMLGLISVATLSIFSKEVISLFFSHNYIKSADALFILVWSFFFSLLGAPLGILIMIEKRRIFRFVLLAIGVVILNILLNLWLIPTYSYIGASLATLVCSLLLYFLKVMFLKSSFPIRLDLYSTGLKLLFATLVMAIVFWVMRDKGLIISLILGGSLFFVILWVLGEFKGEEYSSLGIDIILQKWKKMLFFLR